MLPALLIDGLGLLQGVSFVDVQECLDFAVALANGLEELIGQGFGGDLALVEQGKQFAGGTFDQRHGAALSQRQRARRKTGRCVWARWPTPRRREATGQVRPA